MALEAITQAYNNANGNTMTLTVQHYYMAVMNACIAMGEQFCTCVVTHFMANLVPEPRAEVETSFTKHHGVLSRDQNVQISLDLLLRSEERRVEPLTTRSYTNPLSMPS